MYPAHFYSGLVLQGAVAHEALNLVDGVRAVSDIRDWLLAEFTAGVVIFFIMYIIVSCTQQKSV